MKKYGIMFVMAMLFASVLGGCAEAPVEEPLVDDELVEEEVVEELVEEEPVEEEEL